MLACLHRRCSCGEEVVTSKVQEIFVWKIIQKYMYKLMSAQIFYVYKYVYGEDEEILRM
jgi:hypothetical protein